MDIVIVHFNTPKLTECLVKSINKHMNNVCIHIFDNSDKFPFTTKFDNVQVIDNTRGQIIDFDKWLEKFPYRENTPAKRNGFGSAKHCYTIEKCMEIIGKNFILLDSDVLIKRDLSDFVDETKIFVGDISKWRAKGTTAEAKYRVLPFLLYINVEKCREYNIHFFNEKYMYGLSKEGNSYDTGGFFFKEVEKHKLPWKKENLSNYMVHYLAGSWVNDAKKHDGYKQIGFEEWLNKYKMLWDTREIKKQHIEKIKNSKVIYTCITNDYDNLDDKPFICEGFDYICFTDNLSLRSNVWEIRPMPKESYNVPNHKKQRFIKINPHIVLPEYETSVWVDGNIHVNGDVNELLSDEPIIIPQHPKRNCIYDEMEACFKLKKDSIENMLPQITKYKKEKFPTQYGMVQSGIIIRKHNTDDCKKVMDLWWEELSNGSHRDQLSFNYCLWRNKDVQVKLLDKKIFRSKWFILSGHKNKSKQRTKYSYNPLIQNTVPKKVKVKRRVFF